MEPGYEQLVAAIRSGKPDEVAALLSTHPQLDSQPSPLQVSFFMMALYNGQPACAAEFLRCAHQMDLHEAAAWGDVGRVRELLALDPAAVNAFSVDGFQALGLACFFDHADVVEALVKGGAHVNDPSQNFQQVTPLHSAAAADNAQVCRLLLEHGASVNARQQGEFAPLHAAAQNGNTEMAALFLQHGAEVNARTSQGLTPLSMAQSAKNDEIVRLLIEAGGVE
jgi:ankyrin repeat protein